VEKFPELKGVTLLHNEVFIELETHTTTIFTSATSQKIFTGYGTVLLIGETCADTFKANVKVGDKIQYRRSVDLVPYLDTSHSQNGSKVVPNQAAVFHTFVDVHLGKKPNEDTALISEYDVVAVIHR